MQHLPVPAKVIRQSENLMGNVEKTPANTEICLRADMGFVCGAAPDKNRSILPPLNCILTKIGEA
jgi:hypothetical protein